MKKFIVLLTFFVSLLVSTNPVNAQLLIKSNGNAEVGVDNFDPDNTIINPAYFHWLDTVSVLKIFGRYGDAAAGAHMTFGDTYLYNTYNVAIGELGYTDSDQLWLHGKAGTFVTGCTGRREHS